MLSPCSIKASIYHIIQKESITIDRTSPNKALSFDTSNCNDSFQKIKKSSQNGLRNFAQPSLKINVNQPDFKLQPKLLFKNIDLPHFFQKLFILYSRLKIAATYKN